MPGAGTTATGAGIGATTADSGSVMSTMSSEVVEETFETEGALVLLDGRPRFPGFIAIAGVGFFLALPGEGPLALTGVLTEPMMSAFFAIISSAWEPTQASEQ